MTTAVAEVPFARVGGVAPQEAGGSPLSAQHLRELAAARERFKRVRRCAGVASFDGWCVGAFGAITLLCGVFSLTGWLLGGGMIAIAYIELATVPQVKSLRSGAARRLGWNQLALATLLLAYAGWNLYAAWFGPDPLASTIAAAPEAAEMLAPYSSMARMISAAVYVGVAIVAIFAQGGTALYYFSREKHVAAYREQTPAWIVEMQRAGAAV